MRRGIIVMTALPPTNGHKALIQFGLDFFETEGYDYTLHVLINSRSFEPMDGWVRYLALKNEFQNYYDSCNLIFHLNQNDDVPQNPPDHPDFWNFWCEMIEDETGVTKFDFLFASENYGIELSKVIGASFIPFDIDRVINASKATHLRDNPLSNFDDLVPSLRRKYGVVATFFGQESVGKSTMTRAVFNWGSFDSTRVPEWARGYLEAVGPEITDEKMLNIVYGQFASQTVAREKLTPFILQDTDLLSTIGYYKLWKGSWPKICETLFKVSKSDIYFLMNDSIPFEPDQLRYGGDKRETDMKFWRDLLVEYDCKFHEVKATSPLLQLEEVENILLEEFNKKADFKGFTRE